MFLPISPDFHKKCLCAVNVATLLQATSAEQATWQVRAVGLIVHRPQGGRQIEALFHEKTDVQKQEISVHVLSAPCVWRSSEGDGEKEELGELTLTGKADLLEVCRP